MAIPKKVDSTLIFISIVTKRVIILIKHLLLSQVNVFLVSPFPLLHISYTIFLSIRYFWATILFNFLFCTFRFFSFSLFSYNTKVMAYSGGRPNIYIYLYIFFLSWAPPLYEKSVFLSWGAIAINCVFKRPDIDNDSLPRLPMFLQARRFLVSFLIYIYKQPFRRRALYNGRKFFFFSRGIYPLFYQDMVIFDIIKIVFEKETEEKGKGFSWL